MPQKSQGHAPLCSMPHNIQSNSITQPASLRSRGGSMPKATSLLQQFVGSHECTLKCHTPSLQLVFCGLKYRVGISALPYIRQDWKQDRRVEVYVDQ